MASATSWGSSDGHVLRDYKSTVVFQEQKREKKDGRNFQHQFLDNLQRMPSLQNRIWSF